MDKVHRANTDQEFDSLLKNQKPCRAIAPTFSKLSNEYPSIIFIQVDIDKLITHPLVKTIRSVPTFQMYSNSSLVEEFSGADPSRLKSMVEANK
ncbi:hypothetical protein RB653_009487 [Dictyostelium firmibasis]|uniref:Thioredoxin domain-containing protein n=1 Tax=Dictyostelium firmibasis TaxID=79012 RepID=A0AAN7Z0P4_9MYCE